MLWYCSTPLIKQVTSCAAVPQLSHCSRCLWKDRSIYRRSTDSHARLLLFYLGLQLESQSVQTMLEICAVCLLIKHVFSLSLLSGSTKTWTNICILFQSIWEFRKTDKPIENDSPKTYYTAQNDPPPPKHHHYTMLSTTGIPRALEHKMVHSSNTQASKMQGGPIYISCDPQQHVVILANQI